MSFSNDINPLGPRQTPPAPPKAQAGSSFLNLARLTPLNPQGSMSSAQAAKSTITAYATEMIMPTVNRIQDAYVASAGFSSQVASALSQLPTLMVEDAQGKQTSASMYLNPAELKLLSKLPEHVRRPLLNVDASQPVERVRARMQQQLQIEIGEMVNSGHISFSTSGNSQWELESLLGLANSIERLPLAQRKQLEGVTFQRAAKAAAPSGAKAGLLEQIAVDTIAGRYDINSKTVTLYDRGISDSFPNLSQNLRQSLRTIQNKGESEEVRQLQKILNPYLAMLNQPALGEDGKWGNNTARAVRMVQMEMIERHLGQQPLSAQQSTELNALKLLGASPQFDLISRMTDIQTKMQNLNLLPDPHLKQLLQEFSRSEFGEASLKFLMQDISNDFRSTPSVSRVEEILTHEMGHHFQLGHGNESHYISEFGKLSRWKETASGQQADGYIDGSYTNEDMGDVYHMLACDCKEDKGFYKPDLSPAERSQRFVSDYAATDPMEDFAESYKDFVLDPGRLLKASPEKFFFINALPAIQARKTGAGAKESSHYQPQQIESLVHNLLTERYGKAPTPDTVKTFIRAQFESLMDLKLGNKLGLHADVVLSIVGTHRPLLERVNMPYIPTDKLKQVSNPDEAVFSKLHEQSKRLLVSHGNDPAAKQFFERFSQAGEVDRLFPKASPELRQKLKDPAFASMMMALGQIGGYAYYINQLQNTDIKEAQSYQQAQDYFSRVLDSPSSLLSNKTLSYSWNYLRGVTSEVFNPEEQKVSKALKFFSDLEKDPSKAFPPELWSKLPPDFQDLLRNRRFVQSVSGDHGRYLPSTESTRKVLEEVMSLLEFQRDFGGLD